MWSLMEVELVRTCGSQWGEAVAIFLSVLSIGIAGPISGLHLIQLPASKKTGWGIALTTAKWKIYVSSWGQSMVEEEASYLISKLQHPQLEYKRGAGKLITKTLFYLGWKGRFPWSAHFYMEKGECREEYLCNILIRPKNHSWFLTSSLPW